MTEWIVTFHNGDKVVYEAANRDELWKHLGNDHYVRSDVLRIRQYWPGEGMLDD